MSKSQHCQPLVLSGALDRFSYEETTPEIGREYVDVNIVNDLMNSENSDDVLRDLAITSKFHIADPDVDKCEREAVPNMGHLQSQGEE